MLTCGVSTVGDVIKNVNSATKKTVYTLGVIGDSRLANAYNVSGTRVKRWQNQMAVSWLRALSQQKVEMPPEFSLAASSATTDLILAQATAMAALSPRPDFCLINGGTNDFGVSPGLATMKQAVLNITNAAKILHDAGIVPVIEIDTPRSGGAWTDAAKVSAGYNNGLRTWCVENNILLCDYEAQYIDPTTGGFATGFNVADGVHPSSTGSCVRALQFLECIKPYLSKHQTKMMSPRAAFDATLNPYGNMLANGLIKGTGGTNLGTGASGTVPDSWNNRVITGTMTAVASKLAPAASTEVSDRLQVVLNFTTAGEYSLRPNTGTVGSGATIPAGLVAGELLQAELDIEITGLSGVISGCLLEMFDIGAGGEVSRSTDMNRHFFPGNSLPVVPLPAPNGVGNIYTVINMRYKTPPMVWSDNPGNPSNQLHYRFTIHGEAGATMTFRISACSLHKLPDYL